jgi:hypothetical protein
VEPKLQQYSGNRQKKDDKKWQQLLFKFYEQDIPIRTAVKSSGSCQDGAKESICSKFVLKLIIF